MVLVLWPGRHCWPTPKPSDRMPIIRRHREGKPDSTTCFLPPYGCVFNPVILITPNAVESHFGIAEGNSANSFSTFLGAGALTIQSSISFPHVSFAGTPYLDRKKMYFEMSCITFHLLLRITTTKIHTK